jgi:hypothetical protein
MAVIIDSGQCPSAKGVNDKRQFMPILSKWQDTAFHTPEKIDWLVQIYDECKEYQLHKLLGYEDLDTFMKGKLSPYAGAIKAGFKKRMVSVEPSVEGFSKAILKHLDDDQIQTLISLL